jgi:hypothetical protein
MKKKHNKLNEHNSLTTTVLLPNKDKIELNNFIDNRPLTYKERIDEICTKILSIENFVNDCETYWFGVKNRNGKWSEKVKSCLDVIATYLLRAPDSGIKNVVIH